MDKLEFLKQLNGLDIQDGNLTDSDALALIEVAKRASKPRCQFLELGAWKGKSTACLAAVAVKENGTVWTIDHFEGAPNTKGVGVARFTEIFSVFKQNMKLINAWHSVVFPLVAPLEKVAEIVPTNFFDFIYLDADNRFEEMDTALSLYWKKLKNRGIICGRNLIHHYTDVKQEVEEDLDKEYSSKYMLHPGIIKAVYKHFKEDYQRIENSSVWYKQKTKK